MACSPVHESYNGLATHHAEVCSSIGSLRLDGINALEDSMGVCCWMLADPEIGIFEAGTVFPLSYWSCLQSMEASLRVTA